MSPNKRPKALAQAVERACQNEEYYLDGEWAIAQIREFATAEQEWLAPPHAIRTEGQFLGLEVREDGTLYDSYWTGVPPRRVRDSLRETIELRRKQATFTREN